MSAAANPVSVPAVATNSRLARLWRLTIGLKIVMAVTGVILSGFVLVHMAGNLQVFQGEKGQRLRQTAPRRARLALAGEARPDRFGRIAHRGLADALQRNRRARPVAYSKVTRRESSFASRSMRWTGPLLLVFIVYHILHLTTGTVHPDFREGDAYYNLVTGLRVLPVAIVYVLAMLALGFHLWHGIWSLFQTLGAEQARYESAGRRTATVFTVVVVLGFIAVPLLIATGFVK